MKIKIGGVSYELEESCAGDCRYRDRIEADDLGRIEYTDQVIWIRAGQGPDRRLMTIGHEIAHGIISEYRLRLDMPKEDGIDLLGHALVQLIRDNPELVRLIHEGENHG